jgi:hypothetical protein
MAADYAALRVRVADLGRQIRNVLPQKIDPVSYGRFGDARRDG